MSYTKKLITTDVYYHDSDTPIEYADAIVSGKTVRYGTEVLGQLRHGDKADAIDTNGVRVVIPYDAVIYAVFTETDSEPQEKPDDDFCVEQPSGGSSAVVGNAVVGTAIVGD